MPRHLIAFWNLENLFDTEEAPRSEGLSKRLARELRGWSAAVLDRKIANLAAAILAMDGGAGPAILGVAEVESRAVLDRLAAALGGRYGVLHADSADQRGIDTAFLFDRRRFARVPRSVFTHFVMRRTYTRDILQASFVSKPGGRTLVLFANHWPSRSGGRWESEPYRMTAGETLAHWHSRAHEVLGEDISVLAVGDFNDEPFDRSLVNYALATSSRERVTRARTVRRFQNLMAPLAGAAEGSYVFDGQPNMLDQILAGRSALTGAAGLIVDGPAMVIRPPGVARAPVPFRRPALKGGENPDGFSDHHAVGIYLSED
jgi:predicted extracellular nuclease